MRTELCKPRTILFPVDMSESSGTAAALVSQIARQFDSGVVVLFALEPVEHPFELLTAGQVGARSRREVAHAHLAEFVQSLKLDFRHECRVEEGRSAEVIAAAAEQIDADLICMGTTGRGRFRTFLLGSTTAKVLNDAQVPVLTGAHLERTRHHEAFHPRTVVCAVDVGDQSRTALKSAVLLSNHFGAKLLIVHATESDSSEQPDRIHRMIAEHASSPGIERRLITERAAPAQLVSAVAGEHHADLVVIGRTAPGPFGRLRAQSYAIVRSSPCPVLSV